MVSLKKKQNKKLQKKHFKTYKIRIDAKKELGLDIPKENKRTIPIFIPHVGCKNECVFCNQRKISGQQNIVLADDVKKQIEDALSKYKKDEKEIEVAFFGGSFTGIDKSDQIEYLEVVKEFIDKKEISSIRISTRPDYINQEILDVLKKYNVKIIELGVQSMDDEVLLLSKRGHTSDDVRKASKLIKENGFVLGHQLMCGLPGSNYKKEEYTVDESLSLNPDIIRIYPVYVLEKSELFDMYKKKKYKSLELEEAINRATMMYRECIKKRVNVIRVGLQTTEEISERNNKILGPVCDNYRERILSKIMLEIIENKLDRKHINCKIDKNKEKGKVTILKLIVPASQVNYVIGNNKCNKKYLEEKDVCYVKIVQKKKS